MRAIGLHCYLVTAFAAAAMAQPSAPPIGGSVTTAASTSDAPDTQRPSDYLRAAQAAMVAGRTRQARQALEMAETRMLDRSVPLGQTNTPSDDLAAGQISQARQALQEGNNGAATEFIQSAIASATAQGL